jgi:hypothetical protein
MKVGLMRVLGRVKVCSGTVCSRAVGSEEACSRTVCSGTTCSGKVWSELIDGIICDSICVLGCCGICDVEVICGLGAYCWGLSKVTSSLATASEAISEALCEFGLTLSGTTMLRGCMI